MIYFANFNNLPITAVRDLSEQVDQLHSQLVDLEEEYGRIYDQLQDLIESNKDFAKALKAELKETLESNDDSEKSDDKRPDDAAKSLNNHA